MKKFYSILFCLMAMSITFSSCSKGELDETETDNGGRESIVKNEELTENEISELNDAYNSGYTSTFINALYSKGCIAKPQLTRSGDSDAKYVLTDKGKEYFGYDMFSITDERWVYNRMCLVFQGYYWVKNAEIEQDVEYKWVSLDNPNNDYFEFSNNGVNYYSCLIIKNPIISSNEYRIYEDVFDTKEDYKPTYIKGEDGEFKLPFQNGINGSGGLFFSHIRGTKEIVRDKGNDFRSPKDNNCIMHVSTFRPEDWGLYIRVPKTNK